MNINPRLDNFLSWLAGSVVAATAVMLAIRLQDAKREEALNAQHPPPSPTPAQEPLQLQLARAQEIVIFQRLIGQVHVSGVEVLPIGQRLGLRLLMEARGANGLPGAGHDAQNQRQRH